MHLQKMAQASAEKSKGQKEMRKVGTVVIGTVVIGTVVIDKHWNEGYFKGLLYTVLILAINMEVVLHDSYI